MAKPYQITKETRYLGLPLGFGFLGATYAVSALIYDQPFLFGRAIYLQLVLRTVAFVFLCLTYYFSRKSVEKRFLWNSTFALLIIGTIAASIILSIPDFILPCYSFASALTRVFNLVCIFYLCAHTLRSHLETNERDTIWTPLGYILLGVSQYSLIVYAVDGGNAAFFGSLAIRLAGLAMFIFVSFRSFYYFKKRGK